MASKKLDGGKLKRGSYKAVHGEFYGTPKEVWGFRSAAASANPAAVARAFLEANSALFDFEPGLSGLVVRRVIRSLGASHVILNQVHDRHRVHRGYVTVHMDLEGRVFLAKNRAVPAHLMPGKFEKRLTRSAVVQRARAALPRRQRQATLREVEQLWFPRKAKLVAAWKLRLARANPREEWIIYVNALTGGILKRYDNLAEAPAARGRVFDPSPVTALGDHTSLLSANQRPRVPPAAAYRDVVLNGLDGSGTLSGSRVTTVPTKKRIRRPDGQFLFTSRQAGFEETMVYHHVDSALRYLESLGYRGARSIFRAPVRANVNGTRADNSWYSPVDRLLTFGTGAIDDAEDAETILHELGHAIQDAICPDFGQSEEAAAMGEGFGDYFAASFFEAKKPARYRDSVMSWDGLLVGLDEGSEPPCLRRLDSPLTAADFKAGGDEHDNGLIWSATLWDVRRALGRASADRLIIESHFQLDGFTTFARGARAILDADANLEGGRNKATLLRIFRQRKIGPL